MKLATAREVGERMALLVGQLLHHEISFSVDPLRAHITLEHSRACWYGLTEEQAAEAQKLIHKWERGPSTLLLSASEREWLLRRDLLPIAEPIASACREHLARSAVAQ